LLFLPEFQVLGKRVRNNFELFRRFLIWGILHIIPVETSLKQNHHCRALDFDPIEVTN